MNVIVNKCKRIAYALLAFLPFAQLALAQEGVSYSVCGENLVQNGNFSTDATGWTLDKSSEGWERYHSFLYGKYLFIDRRGGPYKGQSNSALGCGKKTA